MKNKGFILIDSLVTVVIVSLLCLLCIYTYNAYLNYEEGYIDYKQDVDSYYEDIFNSLGECEKCEIEEEDEGDNLDM